MEIKLLANSTWTRQGNANQSSSNTTKSTHLPQGFTVHFLSARLVPGAGEHSISPDWDVQLARETSKHRNKGTFTDSPGSGEVTPQDAMSMHDW